MPRFHNFFPGIVQISGSFMRSVKSPLTASTSAMVGWPALSGNLNIRRKTQRNLYKDLMAGNLRFFQTDQTRPAGISSQAPAFVPSWTQHNIGKNHGHVIRTLSSSYHELTLNSFNSGTKALEVSPRPASGTLFYSKQQLLRKLVYAVTASANLSVIGNTSGAVPSVFDFGTRPMFVAASGNYILQQAHPPLLAQIPIFVPDHGKIRGIRIWIELLTDIRTVITASNSSNPFSGSYSLTGLGTVGLAIQPPNVMKGFYGRPLFNIPQVKGTIFSSYGASALDFGWGKKINDEGSYPLWLQGEDYPNGGMNSSGSTVFGGWMFYGSDLDMRTVFSDDGLVSNPYDASIAPSFVSGGNIARDYSVLSATQPNSVLQRNYGPINSLTASYSGSWIPWMVDPRIKGGYLQAVSGALFTTLGSGSPPPGWLTGPGGTANVNEFATTGTQLGPTTIRPVWPLLDDVYSILDYSNPSVDSTPASRYVGTGKVIGFRPGLRGTDIFGTWFLNIWNGSAGLWFRQVRLEFLVDQREGPSVGTSQRQKFYQKTGTPVRSTQTVFKASTVAGGAISGVGDALSGGTETCYILPPSQYGRSVGITDNTGSSTDFAVFTRLTGALGDRMAASASLSVSGTAGVLYSYLNNQFGTPYIPISSGSGIGSSYQFFNTDDVPTKAIISDIIRSRPLIPQAHRLQDVVTRLGGFQTKRDQIFQKIQDLQIQALSGSS